MRTKNINITQNTFALYKQKIHKNLKKLKLMLRTSPKINIYYWVPSKPPTITVRVCEESKLSSWHKYIHANSHKLAKHCIQSLKAYITQV